MSQYELAIWFVGVIGEAAAVGLMLYRRIYRILPIFCLFLIWNICSDATMMYLSHQLGTQDPSRYMRIYMVDLSLEFCMQFAVLVELAWSVLRPIRAAIPRRFILVISALLILLGGAVWPVAGKLVLSGPNPQWHTLLQLQQSFSILRVIFVLVLAGFSQLLAIGWRDRELQVATGLGFYSLMSLGVSILHTHRATAAVYHNVDLLIPASYFCSLVYWILSFVQQEAPRQEFTPRMESFLLAVSGAARSNRMTLEQLRKSSK